MDHAPRPECIPCTKVQQSLAWSFENHNIIYNESQCTIKNLWCELYMECTLAPGRKAVLSRGKHVCCSTILK